MNTPNKRGRGRPKGSGKKKDEKSVLDSAVSIPYEQETSDDPKRQSMIDLMEMGRTAMHFSPDGEVKRLDPLSGELAAALANAENKNQVTEILEIPIAELKKKFGTVYDPYQNPRFKSKNNLK